MRLLPAVALAFVLLLAAPAMAVGPAPSHASSQSSSDADSPISITVDDLTAITVDDSTSTAADALVPGVGGAFVESSAVEVPDRADPWQVIRIAVTQGGDAVWTVESRYALESDEDVESFESFADAVVNGTADTEFDLEAIEAFAERADEAIDREMAIVDSEWDDPHVESDGSTPSPENASVGVLSKSFTWEGFAERIGSRIYLGDALHVDDERLFGTLVDGQRLVIEPPPNHSYDDLPIPPDNGTLVWDGPHEFGEDEIRVTYREGASFGGEHELTATVVDVDGVPVEDVTVTLESSLGELEAVTGANGQVTFHELPDGEYTLSVEYDGDAAEETVEIDDDDSVTLTMEFVGYTVTAIVEDDGSPLEGALVTLVGPDGSEWTAETDVDGLVTFEGLADGEYTLSVEDDGSTTDFDLEIDGGDERITLDTAAGGFFGSTLSILVVAGTIVALALGAYVLWKREDDDSKDAGIDGLAGVIGTPSRAGTDETADGELEETADGELEETTDAKMGETTDAEIDGVAGSDTGAVADTDDDETATPRDTDDPAPTVSYDEARTEDIAGGIDPDLLSDEERILWLLRENNGRMKQATIVGETNWSDAKVSLLLSQMADDGEIEKLRIGRENLITLPEIDPTEVD